MGGARFIPRPTRPILGTLPSPVPVPDSTPVDQPYPVTYGAHNVSQEH
jgi:hypothetical protein